MEFEWFGHGSQAASITHRPTPQPSPCAEDLREPTRSRVSASLKVNDAVLAAQPRARCHARPSHLAACLARSRSQAPLRGGDHRRWRPRPGDGLLPRQGARRHRCRGPGEGLAGRRQHRTQHHDRALQLPAERQRPLLRAFLATLGRPQPGPQFQRHVQPAGRAQSVPFGRPARRRRPPRQRHAPERHRRRAARPRAGARHAPDARFRRRALSDPRRSPAAARRHRAPRCRRLGLRARGRSSRDRHHPELRGHRHPPGRRARRGRRDHAGADRRQQDRHRRRRQHFAHRARWPISLCRSRATSCRRS